MFKKLVVISMCAFLLTGCGKYDFKEVYRYPCQDPANWEKDFCKVPVCDVNRTCPEHIFKGQRDPRLGPPKDGQTQTFNQSLSPTGACVAQQTQGANCGK